MSANAFSSLPGRRSIGVAVAVAAVLFAAGFGMAAGFAGLGEVRVHLGRLGAAVVMQLLALSLLNYALRSARWHLFASGLGLGLPFWRNALYFVAGFALTTTPGKLGEAVRLWLLSRNEGYAYARTMPALIGDRVSDTHAVLLLCTLGVGAFSAYLWSAALVAAIAAGLTLLLVWPGLLLRITTALYRLLGRRARLFAGLRRTLRLSVPLFRWRIGGAALALGLCGWLAEAWAFHLLLAAMGAELPTARSIFIFAFAMVVGAVSMLPGGLGGTEATMVGLLVASGVEIELAVAATAVIRLTTLWFAVALGLGALGAAMRLGQRAPVSLQGMAAS